MRAGRSLAGSRPSDRRRGAPVSHLFLFISQPPQTLRVKIVFRYRLYYFVSVLGGQRNLRTISQATK